MTIHTEVAKKDYVNFNLYHLKNAKSNKKIRIIVYTFGLAIFVFMYVFRNHYFWDSYVAGFISQVILWSIIYLLIFYLPAPLIVRLQVKMMLKDGKHNDFIGKQTITLCDDHLEKTNLNEASQIKYSSIEKICHGYGCYFIYTGSIKAIIVPDAAFVEDTQKHEFLSLLKQKTGRSVIYSRRAR